MPTTPPGLSDTTTGIMTLLNSLMNSVEEAVRIDDLTAFCRLLQEAVPDGIDDEDIQSWLVQNETVVRELRSSIVTLAVNEASVELFGADSAAQLIEHTNATQGSVNSPDFLGFVAAVHKGAAEFNGTFYRHNMDGRLLTGSVETQFIRVSTRVLACHVIGQTQAVRELEDQLSKIRQLHSLAVGAAGIGCWEVSFVDQLMSADVTCHQLLGFSDNGLPTIPDEYAELIHPDDRDNCISAALDLSLGHTDEYHIEHRCHVCGDTWRWFVSHGRSVKSLPDGRSARMVGTLRLTDREKKTADLLRIEKQGFAMQAANLSLQETLDYLCTSLEEVFPDRRCGINLYDETTRSFCGGAAPSMPPDFRQLFEGFPIDGDPTLCSDALQTGEPIGVDDVLQDQRYTKMHDNYRRWNVRSGWSVPALTPDGRPLATVCFLSDQPGPAVASDLELVAKLGETLAILIHQYQQDEQQQQLELQLQVQDKFRSLGELAGGIAHDFNNLLTVISGHGELLQLQLADNPDAVEVTEKILHAVQLATSLCKQMLTFSGRVSIQLESVDMNDVARQVCGLLRPGLPEGITLQTRFSAGPALLNGDRGMLSQIILNLVSNAAEAAAVEGGRVSVSIGLDDVDVPQEELLLADSRAETDDWVCITVIDNGNGIADDIREQIFDPFFTTRESGKGLGLATVLGIVRRHRGIVHMSSEIGETVFRVWLPADCDDSAIASVPESTVNSGAHRRVILVDDDRGVRHSLAGMLQAAGYDTLAFNSGNSFLQYVSEVQPDDVILMDQNMPGLKGNETFEQLRKRDIQNPVCFVTAFGTAPLQKIVEEHSNCMIVEKPLRMNTICDAINRLSARACHN